MKTKIKFRLWNPKTQKFVNGYKEANKLSLGTANDQKDNTALCIAYANAPDEYLTFCRFTGLHDKQGKEIYEGDILSEETIEDIKGIDITNSYKYLVEWGVGGFMLKHLSVPNLIDQNITQVQDLEVIGNVYEHKELMKHGRRTKGRR